MRTGNLVRLAFHPALLTLLFVIPALSQQRWERNYGWVWYDEGSSVQQTSDGGYIVAGVYDYSGFNQQVYLIKTNASGDTLWTRTYGGMSYDWGYSVQQTSDGGYIVAGHTSSFGNGWQAYLIKTNASGDTLWTKTFGDTAYDLGYSVAQTSDTGYIVAGWSNSFGNGFQVYLIKTNASGDTLWTRTYGGAGRDEGHSVQQTSDGGYIVAGHTDSFGNNRQVYLIKTNALGDTLWTKTYGDTAFDLGQSVQQTTDMGYIVAGSTNSFGNGYQVYLIKTNALGDTLWTKTYGGVNDDHGSSVQQTSDGGYIVAGKSGSFGNGWQVYLIKTNALGDTLWTRTYGGVDDEDGLSVRPTQDGGYIVAGGTSSFGISGDVYLIKTDANGSSGVEENSGVRDQRSEVRLTATPNPFTSFATVPSHSSDRFALYDISGRRVGTYRGDRIGEGLPPGVYFLRPERLWSKPLRVVKVK
jgi:hypothetical protein